MKVVEKQQSHDNNIEDIPDQEPTSTGKARESEESRVDGDMRKQQKKDCEPDDKTLARGETKVVKVLRVSVLVLLLVTATLTSVGVYIYTSNEETLNFESGYQAGAQRIVESFHDAVERRLGAVNSMATAITSHSLDTEQAFPFVTIPNFEIRGSDTRVQADATGIIWMPLVTDETRDAWEEYALINRSQIDEAFLEDMKQIEKQDEYFGLTNSNSDTGNWKSQQAQQGAFPNDGTGYIPRIWSSGAVGPPGVEAEGKGPYLPVWQGR
jgi:hypothetical protein